MEFLVFHDGKSVIFFSLSLSLELSLHLGFTFLEDFVTSEIGLYVSCALVIAVAWIFESLSDPKLKCDNCSSRKIDCLSGESSKQYWLHANKDGSPDKRYKTNSLVANYVSIWECRDCSTKTKFKHRANTQPSLTDKVIDSASFKA